MDEYIVEEYIKPTVKRNTYDKSDDHYISEQDEVSDNESSKSELGSDEEEVDDSEYKKVNGQSEVTEPQEVNKQKEIKKKPQKKAIPEIPTEPVRTNCRLILHISNLSEETTKSMMEDFFSDAGAIKSVRIPKRRGTNNFAFVEMRDIEGYKNGLKLNGRELDSKNIRVQEGSKNKKHSSKLKGKRKAQNNVNDGNSIKKRKFK